MKATIDLPDPVFEALRTRADQLGSSVEAIILDAIEIVIAHGPKPANGGHRVQLPLIRSKHPGSLRSLTNAEVDDLLD